MHFTASWDSTSGRDHRRCLVQPPAQSRTARRPDWVSQGFIQSDGENLKVWRLCKRSEKFLSHLGSEIIDISVMSSVGCYFACVTTSSMSSTACRQGMGCSRTGRTLPKCLHELVQCLASVPASRPEKPEQLLFFAKVGGARLLPPAKLHRRLSLVLTSSGQPLRSTVWLFSL